MQSNQEGIQEELTWNVPDLTKEDIIQKYESSPHIRTEPNYCEVRLVDKYLVKQIFAKDKNQGLDPMRQIKILRTIKCPFSAKYYDAFIHKGRLYIVMECVDSHSIYQKLEKNSNGIDEGALSQIIAQVLILLNFLKEKHGVMHRDLSPSSIYLSREGRVKITDYDLSKQLDTAKGEVQTKTYTGGSRYNAPERLLNQEYGFSVDIWSLGICAAEMFQGSNPLDPKQFANPQGKMKYLEKVKGDLKKSLGWKNESDPVIDTSATTEKESIYLEKKEEDERKASGELVDFVLKCCQYQPSERPTAFDLLHHPFIKKHNDMEKIEKIANCMDYDGTEDIPVFEKVLKFLESDGEDPDESDNYF